MKLACVVAVVLATSGCATVLSTADIGPHVYGGVRTDADLVGNSTSAPLRAFGIVDLPLSAVLDTVFLPVTIPWSLARGREPTPRDERDALLVAALDPEDPLAKAGLAPGDRVVGLDGSVFTSRADREARLIAARARDTLLLVIRRGGRDLMVLVPGPPFFEAPEATLVPSHRGD